MTKNGPSSIAPHLTISPDGTHLLADGVPIFLLADTLWAAFSRMSDEEWVDALRLRRRQGFNAVNISVLPIAHDRSFSPAEVAPFEARTDGSWDLDALESSYFERARRMVKTAHEHGLITVLVGLWVNYVPNTWGSEQTPELAMDEPQMDRYVDQLIESFADLRPIFCVSGDDSLDDDVALGRYGRALHRFHAGAPDVLTTLHSNPGAFIPTDWVEDEALDLLSYQSGHDHGWDMRATDLAQRHSELLPRRPVNSMEPCYEGHGYGAGAKRHGARDVRLASWTGLLSGAGAGLGYAAHGAWSWHRAGEPFNGEHFSGTPLPAARAMELPGAWDVGLLRRIVEAHSLYNLIPRQELIIDDRVGARLGMSPAGDQAVIYLPEAFVLTLDLDTTSWHMSAWDLSRGRRDHVARAIINGQTRFEQPDVIGDLVYLLEKA